jgi:uncharacterized membrane protein (UPF0127 family)
MKKKRIGFNYKKKKIILDVNTCNNFEKVIGLMFSSRKAKPLLFEFEKPVKISIHSLFVFYPFLALWMDNKDNIVDKRIVDPFKISVSPNKKFSKLLEIPFNEDNRHLIELLVGD